MRIEESKPSDNGRFMSVDCVDFWFDGPGDKTVRPLTGVLLEHAKAAREMIVAEEAKRKQQPSENGHSE